MDGLRDAYKDEDEESEQQDGSLPRPPEGAGVGAAAAVAAVVSDSLPAPPLASGLGDLGQQMEEKSEVVETVMAAEGVVAEERVSGGDEELQVCEERMAEGGAEEDGGQERGDEDNVETEQNGAGRERGFPSEEEEEEGEDYEGEEEEPEEGEDEEEEEGMEEDREGRCPMTPSSEPPVPPSSQSNLTPPSDPTPSEFVNGGYYEEEEDEDDEDEGNEDEDDDDSEANAQPPLKKQKTLTCLTAPSSTSPAVPAADLSSAAENLLPPAGSSAAALDASAASTTASKKPKKKSSNVWRKSASRKGKKKGKSGGSNNFAPPEDKVLITPIPRFPDKSDDSPDATICLSKVYKAEKVELSEDRLTAGSTKGYRMVRATRGVVEGAWYFEIKVVRLGETGHTRLGWTTEKGDLQAPVGYDGNSFGYRDIDGTKIHRALREKYGDEGYAEGDVIGFYINLPDGESYAPKPPHLVWYKGQRYMYSADGKDEPPKVIPGERKIPKMLQLTFLLPLSPYMGVIW